MCVKDSFFFLRQEKKERKWYSDGLSEQKKERSGGVSPADVWDERARGEGKRRPEGTHLAGAGTASEEWWKEGTEEDRADLSRQPDGGHLAFTPAGSKAITGSRAGNWSEATHVWKRSLWTLHLKYCRRWGCKQRDQSESCHNPGERWQGPGWWEWNDDKGSDSAECGRKSWQNVLTDWT